MGATSRRRSGRSRATRRCTSRAPSGWRRSAPRSWPSRRRDLRARGEARRRQRDAQEGKGGCQSGKRGAEEAQQEGQTQEDEEVEPRFCFWLLGFLLSGLFLCSCSSRSFPLPVSGVLPRPLGLGFCDALAAGRFKYNCLYI